MFRLVIIALLIGLVLWYFFVSSGTHKKIGHKVSEFRKNFEESDENNKNKNKN